MRKSNPAASAVDACPIGKRCLCGALPPWRRQVFHRLLSGESEKQATAALGISINTLHQHATALYRQFNVSGRAELLALVLKTAAPLRPRAIRHDLGLSEAEREYLTGLIRSVGTGSRQSAVHARIILQCDGSRDDYVLANDLGVSIRTIERLRENFIRSGVAAVARKPGVLRGADRFKNLLICRS